MAWSSVSGTGVPILDSAGVYLYDLQVTSTCTIRADVAGPELIMFGVIEANIETSFVNNSTSMALYGYLDNYSAGSFVVLPVQTSGSAPPNTIIFYNLSYLGSNRQTDVIDVNTPTPGRPSLLSTFLPGLRITQAPNIEQFAFISYTSSGRSSTPIQRTWADPVNTAFKDPCILYLESIGKWMAVLCRVRTLTASPPDAENSISDIVAYVADDKTFTTNVMGPYWLVSSMHALPGVPDRFWLGVPSAFEARDPESGDRLYVYYTLDPSDLTRVTDSSGQRADEGTFPSTFVTSPEEFDEAMPEGALLPGIGVSIFDVSRFQNPPPSSRYSRASDHYWDALSRTPRLTTFYEMAQLLEVPKIYSGRVRLWFAVYGSPSSEVVSFDDVLADRHPVDPSVICLSMANNIRSTQMIGGQPTEHVTMFFATSNRAGISFLSGGHGVWTAHACANNQALVVLDEFGARVNSTFGGVFGVDWLIRRCSFDTNLRISLDPVGMVAASTEPTARYIDPDPVRLLGGGLRVYMGEQNSTNTAAVVIQLRYTQTVSLSDAFISPTNAWT